MPKYVWENGFYKLNPNYGKSSYVSEKISEGVSTYSDQTALFPYNYNPKTVELPTINPLPDDFHLIDIFPFQEIKNFLVATGGEMFLTVFVIVVSCVALGLTWRWMKIKTIQCIDKLNHKTLNE